MLFSSKHGVFLTPHETEFFLLLFADDLTLSAPTVTGLQIRTTQRICLRVNRDKTKIFVFCHLENREQWLYGKDKLKVVNEYTYLGSGFFFFTMISVNNAGRDFVIRAARGTIETLNTIKRLKCNFEKYLNS